MYDEELTAMVGCEFTPVLALRTTGALAYYVNGFVLQEQASRQEDRGQPADQLAALAELLDGGALAHCSWPSVRAAVRSAKRPSSMACGR